MSKNPRFLMHWWLTAYNKYCHNIPFNLDALTVLPDAGDISTHSVSIECVLPDSSEQVDNINSARDNESMQILVPVYIQ